LVPTATMILLLVATSNLVVLGQLRSLSPPRLETWSHARSRSGAGAHTARYITSKLNDQCNDLINRIRNGETNFSLMLVKICIDLYIQLTNEQPANVERWDGLNTLRAYQKTRMQAEKSFSSSKRRVKVTKP